MINKFLVLLTLLFTATSAQAYFGELSVPAHSYFGNNTGAAATSSPITRTQLTADLNQFTSLLQGMCPASGGGTVNFLRADGTFAAPPGAAYTFADSLVNTLGTVTLVGDTASPTANQYYGTDAGSTLGYYNLPAGTGTVTNVSGVNTNGFSFSIANPTSTPAITLSTSITGVLKGNGTAISAATAGTDYSLGTSGNATGIVKSTTGTGALTTAIAADFPTLNQNTTGNAATVTTNANLTGPVTSVGNATSVTNNAITNAMLAQMATHTFKGNNTGGTANALDLTATQLTAELNDFVGDSGLGGTKGLVPAPAAGDGALGKFLKADGTWTTPAGAGTVTSVSVVTANGVSGSVANATSTPAITLTLGAITPSSVAAVGTVTGSNLSGTNTGDQTITLTSDVTGSGTGSFATTIAANAVTNAKAAQMAAHTFKGNNTGSTANALDLTATQLTAELNLFTSGLQGLTPASGGGAVNFLRADGTWAVPPGTGGGGGSSAIFSLEDATVPYVHFGQHVQTSTQSLVAVNIGMFNSGLSGSTVIRLNQYRAGALINSATASQAASSGNPVASVGVALSGTLSLLSGDLVTADCVSNSTGTPNNLTVEYQ